MKKIQLLHTGNTPWQWNQCMENLNKQTFSFLSCILCTQALTSTRSKLLGKLSALFLIVAVIATSQIISLCLRKFWYFLHSFLINCQEMTEFLGS